MPIIIVKSERQTGKTEAAIDFFIKNKEVTTYLVPKQIDIKIIEGRLLKKVKKTKRECPELKNIISARTSFKVSDNNKFIIFDDITCLGIWDTIWAAYSPLAVNTTFIFFLSDVPENLKNLPFISLKEFKELNLKIFSWQKSFKNYLKQTNG